MTDYQTYREIMDELLKPIVPFDLDVDTLRRLYESKAVYLENLRVKCFVELNSKKSAHFTQDDYTFILKAIEETKNHLRSLLLVAINENLARRKAS